MAYSFIQTDKTNLPLYFKKLDTNCSYHADVGIICPLIYKKDSICIEPYSVISQQNQKNISNLIVEFWPEYNEDFIKTNFTERDVLYVCHDTKNVIGCVAIDRKRFFPFISTLFVDKNNRKKGFAKLLLYFAETFIKEYNFSVSHLWCTTNLVDFYKKHGYEFKEKEDDIIVMQKNLETLIYQ